MLVKGSNSASADNTALKADSSHAGRTVNSTNSAATPAKKIPAPATRLLQVTPTRMAAMSSTTANTRKASRLPEVNMERMPFIR